MARQRYKKRGGLLPVWTGGLYPLAATLLLLPALGAWIALVRQVRGLSGPWTAWAPFLAGAASYGLIQWIFRRPMTLYVFGHEITHAAAAYLSGYKVKSLFVSEKGGEVRLSDSNVAVALAPYCVPIYTVGVLALFALIRRYAPQAAPPLWVGAGLGFTLAFHLALTLHALRQNQPDLRHAGTFFSVVAIALANALVLALVAKALFPDGVSLAAFAGDWAVDTRFLAERVRDGAVAAGGRVRRWAKGVPL